MPRWLRTLRSAVRKLTGSASHVRQSEASRESDVETDPAVADSRKTGGDPGRKGSDSTTTGPGESENYVGRIAGEDPGTEQRSGAEARREQD